MLNAKAISDLLSKNSDDRLYKCWYLMTPNGTLLASTQPIDYKHLRKQVAMAALSWQEHRRTKAAEPDGNASSEMTMHHQLYTLILESDFSNVLIRQVQPELLLVLEGGVPPRKQTFEPRVTAEGPGGEPLHDRRTANSELGISMSSKAESRLSANPAGGVLGLHRKKLDAMAAAIASDFEQTGFNMPGETVNKLF